MELTSLAILARLMDERHFYTRTAQLLENENIEFQIARDPRHVAGYDQVHQVGFPARQHEHSIEFRPIAVAAGVSRSVKTSTIVIARFAHSFRASASCWSIEVECFVCTSVEARQ